MKILYDLHSSQPEMYNTFHGGGEVGKSIFNRLVEYLPQSNTFIDVVYDSSRYFEEWIISKCEINGINLIDIKNMDQVEDLLLTNKYDIYFSSLMYMPFKNSEIYSKTKVINIVHGMRKVEMPFDYTMFLHATNIKEIIYSTYIMLFRKRYIRRSIEDFAKFFEKSAKATFITDSSHSKYSFIKSLKNDALIEKMIVLSPPTRINIGEADDSVVERYKITSKKYFLIINANRWIKNAYRSIKALDELYSSHPELEMDCVVIGATRLQSFGRLYNSKRFNFISYVSSEELDGFFKHAALFIYPTLNEGFGLPPLEAMKYGTPSIVSAISAVTEVCKDKVLYFNPYDKEEMKIRILQAVYEKPFNEDLLNAYYQQVMQRISFDTDYIVKLILGLENAGEDNERK